MRALFPVGVRVPVGSPFIQTPEESSPGRGRKGAVSYHIGTGAVPQDWVSPGQHITGGHCGRSSDSAEESRHRLKYFIQ